MRVLLQQEQDPRANTLFKLTKPGPWLTNVFVIGKVCSIIVEHLSVMNIIFPAPPLRIYEKKQL